MAAKCLTGELVEAVRVLRAGGGAFRPLPAAGAGSKTADMDAALAGSAGERSKAICLFILVGSSIKMGPTGLYDSPGGATLAGEGSRFLQRFQWTLLCRRWAGSDRRTRVPIFNGRSGGSKIRAN